MVQGRGNEEMGNGCGCLPGAWGRYKDEGGRGIEYKQPSSFGSRRGDQDRTSETVFINLQRCKHIGSPGMYVYYYRTYEKAVSGGGEREKGEHVLRDTTSRGLYVRVWPPHTSERRGGGGGCEQEGWQGGEGPGPCGP